jgi:AraC family transcriptional regulator
MSIRFVTRPSFHLVGLRGRFTPETMGDIPALWRRFVAGLESIPGRVEGATYGVCVPVPQPTDGSPPGLDITAAVEVRGAGPAPQGHVALTVPAATYAVVTHEGSIAGIGATWDAIFRDHLPSAGRRPKQGPAFERYDARWDPRTASGPVDIFVPVEETPAGQER